MDLWQRQFAVRWKWALLHLGIEIAARGASADQAGIDGGY